MKSLQFSKLMINEPLKCFFIIAIKRENRKNNLNFLISRSLRMDDAFKLSKHKTCNDRVGN